MRPRRSGSVGANARATRSAIFTAELVRTRQCPPPGNFPGVGIADGSFPAIIGKAWAAERGLLPCAALDFGAPAMSLELIGRKLGMTQIFTEEGDRVPVTVIEAGPCTVVQKKTGARDGYT